MKKSRFLLIVALIMAIIPMTQVTAYAKAPKGPIVSVILTDKSYVYDGEQKTPKVTVKDSRGVVIPKKLYTVKYSEGRKNVGVYNVKVTYKADKRIYKVVSFKIVPKTTQVKKITPTSNVITVEWKKQAQQAEGYQFQYATKKDFSNAKTQKFPVSDVRVCAFKANPAKKYYVRVRCYKTVNDHTLYSSWSQTKVVSAFENGKRVVLK